MGETPVIRFYRPREPYGEFSNFARYQINFLGKEWPTSEHLFQAQKFTTTEPEYAEAIRLAPTPKDAARMGRDHTHQRRLDWEKVKDNVMRLAVLLKFTSHESLKGLLLSTGDTHLIEASPIDYYWGEGANRTGQNMLGKILEETRTLLRTNTILKKEI